MSKKCVRKKAFIGSIIGAVGNIVGGVISGRRKKKAEEQKYRQEQRIENRRAGIEEAAAISAQINNQQYVDDYLNKVSLKCGGKVKTKRDTRTKAKLGAMGQSAIGGAANAVSSIATAFMTPNKISPTVTKYDDFTVEKKESLTPNSYTTPTVAPINNSTIAANNINTTLPNTNIVNTSNNIANRMQPQMARYGCKKHTKNRK